MERVIEYGNKGRTSIGCAFPGVVDDCSFIHEISGKLADKFLYLLVLRLMLLSVMDLWCGIPLILFLSLKCLLKCRMI